MFSRWDVVGPRVWYPMASLEQSMMDLDHMADRMFSHAHHSLFDVPTIEDDDEFFRDLPVQSRSEQQQQQQQAQAQAQTPAAAQEQEQAPTDANDQNKHTYSTYSYSSSSLLDDKGQRVVSTRRRYEDSAGRLKALHERTIQDKTMRSVWNRQSKDDDGKHETICSDGTTGEEFEQAWKRTPFGQAHAQKEQEQAKQIENDKAKSA